MKGRGLRSELCMGFARGREQVTVSDSFSSVVAVTSEASDAIQKVGALCP